MAALALMPSSSRQREAKPSAVSSRSSVTPMRRSAESFSSRRSKAWSRLRWISVPGLKPLGIVGHLVGEQAPVAALRDVDAQAGELPAARRGS
jgi:hypothetical protein